jgi:ketosteroid isomerase-like protein
MAFAFDDYFARYAAAFDTFDADAIASFYRVPCLMVRSDGVFPCEDRERLVAMLRSRLAAHQAQGYERTTADALSANVVGDGLALVTVTWTIRFRDAASMTFRNTYEVIRLEGRWSIIVSTTHDDGM